MNSVPLFQSQQRQMLNYFRQPDSVPPPSGFATERLSVYVDLLYNKFDESLSACFPVARRILTPDAWRSLLRDFIAEHRCATPYYRRIPDEFVDYLLQERHSPHDLPFLAELAHFEWTDLQLSIAEAEPFSVDRVSDTQLLANVSVFAPVMQLLQYQWPVQQITADHQPCEMPTTATYILGFRDADEQVQFIALNPMTAQLLALLGNGLTGRQALDALGKSLNTADLSSFLHFGLETLNELNRRGAIIAVRAAGMI